MRVIRGDVAFENPRAGRALAALDRDEVLEPDRDAEQRMERLERAGAGPAGGGQSSVGRIRLGQGAFTVDRQPCVEGTVSSLGRLERGERRLARAQLAGVQPPSQLMGQEAGRVGHGAGSPLGMPGAWASVIRRL